MSDTFNKALAQAEKLSTQDNAKSVLDNIYSTLGNIDPPLTIARKLGLNIPSGEDLTTLVHTVAEGVSPGTDIREIVEGSEKISEGNVVSGGLQTLGGVAGAAIPFSKQIRGIGKVVEDLPVFPKPQRMFPEDARPAGGEYLNPKTQDILTGMLTKRGRIVIPKEGPPSFKISPEKSDVVGSPDIKKATKIHTNLLNKKRTGWSWKKTPEGYDNVPAIVSVENKGKHYYALDVDFPKGVELKRFATKKTEPRLRPTVEKGFVELGKPIGVMVLRGKEHPVYDKIINRKSGGLVSLKEQEMPMVYRANGGGIDINYEGMEDIESETIESEVPSLNPATEVRQLSKPTPVIIDDSENVGGETPEEREEREFSDRIAAQNFAFRDNQQSIYNQFINQYGGEKDPLGIFNIMSSTPMGRAAMAAGAGFGPNSEGSMGVIGNYIDQMSGLGQFAIDSMVDPLDLEDAELGGKTRGDILGELINEEDKDDKDKNKVKGLTDFVPFEKLKNPYQNVPMVYRAIAPGGIALTAGTAALNKLQDWSGLVGEAKMAGERVGIDTQGNIVPNIFLKKGGGGLSSLQEMPMVYRQTNGQTSYEDDVAPPDLADLTGAIVDDTDNDNLLSGYQDDGGADILGGTTRLPDGRVAIKRGGLDRPSDDEFTGTFVKDSGLLGQRLAQDLKPLGSDLPWWQQLVIPGNFYSRIATGAGNLIKDAFGIEYLADTLDGKSGAITKDGVFMYLSPEDDPNYDESLLTAEGDTSGLLAPEVKGVEKFKKELEEVEERYSKKPTKRKNVFEIALLDQIYGPGVGKTMVG